MRDEGIRFGRPGRTGQDRTGENGGFFLSLLTYHTHILFFFFSPYTLFLFPMFSPLLFFLFKLKKNFKSYIKINKGGRTRREINIIVQAWSPHPRRNETRGRAKNLKRLVIGNRVAERDDKKGKIKKAS
jgi:hypothetical protein